MVVISFNNFECCMSRNIGFVTLVTEAVTVGCVQVKLHDYGCTLRAYRASLMSNLRLYGDMHRFIPALAAMEGAAISEIEVPIPLTYVLSLVSRI